MKCSETSSQAPIVEQPDLDVEVEVASNVEIIEPDAVGDGERFGAKPTKPDRKARKTKSEGDAAPLPIGHSRGRGRAWAWLPEEDRRAILNLAPGWIVGRESEGYTLEWIRERVESFLLQQRAHASTLSNDWVASLEKWVFDPRFKPRRAFGRAGRPSADDIANAAFDIKD